MIALSSLKFLLGDEYMKFLSALVGVCALLLMSSAHAQGAEQSAKHPPIEAYGALPLVSDVAISPNGQKIAYLSADFGKEFMAVVDLTNGERQAISTEQVRARWVDFADNEVVLLGASESTRIFGYRGKIQYSAAFSFNTRTENVRQLLKGSDTLYPGQSGIGQIVGAVEGSDKVLMPAYSKSGSHPTFDLYRVDMSSGRGRIYRRGRSSTIDWFVDKTGEAIGREQLDIKDRKYFFQHYLNGKWTTIVERDDTVVSPFSISGLRSDGQAYVVVTNSDDGEAEDVHFLTFDGKLSPPVVSDDEKSVDYLIQDTNRTVLGIKFSGLRPSYKFFDPAIDEAMQTLVDTFPGQSFHLSSWSDNFERIVLRSEGGGQEPTYFLYEPATKSLSKLFQTYNVSGAQLGYTFSIEYKAQDGETISAIVTAPPGVNISGERPNLPTIVLPHGGPAAYDSVGFDWLAQFFANRGYLVLQPNFRGSSGFGAKFLLAGYGEWGGLMQDDVTDGINALITGGYTDPERVCIMGASYGGYAALMGAAKTPDLYKCAVSIAGVSDLEEFIKDNIRRGGDDSYSVAYWTRNIGDVKDDKEKLRNTSPARLADQIKIPVLLLHGKDDSVVDYNQSRTMERALKKADKPVTLITLRNEDHYLSFADTRIQTLEETSKFIDAHIGPNATVTSAGAP